MKFSKAYGMHRNNPAVKEKLDDRDNHAKKHPDCYHLLLRVNSIITDSCSADFFSHCPQRSKLEILFPLPDETSVICTQSILREKKDFMLLIYKYFSTTSMVMPIC